MRLSTALALMLPLLLGGCLSFGGSSPPARTTIVMPPGNGGPPAIVCSDGSSNPCN
jgi:hypothetical protein